MSNPSLKTTVIDQASPVADLSGADVFAVVGVATGGTAGTVYTLTDPTAAVSLLQSGPACELVAYLLGNQQGTILFSKATSDVAGTSSAITHVGTGPTCTLSGNPNDSLQGVVTIKQGGPVGTATFNYSLDGGNTQSVELVTSATYVIPGTGITFAFPAGTYVAGETYSWSSVEPTASGNNVSAALTALFNAGIQFGLVYVVGLPQGVSDAAIATASATLSGALEGSLDAQYALERFYCGVHEVGHVAQNATGAAALVTAYSSVVAMRVAAAHGFGWIQSKISGQVQYRPFGWPFLQRLRSIPFSKPAHRVRDGALAMQTPPNQTDPIEWDETYATVDLDGARLVTARTWPDKPGRAFVTRPKLLGANGTSFDQVQLLRVMNEVCRQNRAFLLQFMNDDEILTNPINPDGSGGTIDEEQAQRIEKAEDAFLLPFVAGKHCRALKVTIDRNYNMVANRKMKTHVRIRPNLPIENIDTELAFDQTLSVGG